MNHVILSCRSVNIKRNMFTIKVNNDSFIKDFNHRNFYGVCGPLKFKVQKISLFSPNCPFGKMSFRRKVRSSGSTKRPSAKCPFGKVSFGKMSGHRWLFGVIWKVETRLHMEMLDLIENNFKVMLNTF